MRKYTPRDIESKWQKIWEDSGIYQTSEDPNKPKRYVLEYFPYPSGAAMHVGHVRNYTIGDAMARFYRMQGFNVMHPMGWDAFGLPAENYAIKNNISPQQAIAENTAKFKQQLTQMGFSYDWSREVNSSSPDYYKWTQWFFTLLLERGLAYQKESLQWWCDFDKTVLANEQVEAGKCWRCGSEVTKKPLKQWFFKITDYADRLAEDLEKLDWSESIKSMQRNWIGKSKGAEIDFAVGENFKTKDSLKFNPELSGLVKSGKKTVTFRAEKKDLKPGDYAKLYTRYSADEVEAFGIAKISEVSEAKLKDIPLDYPGHEDYKDQNERLEQFKKIYGDNINGNSKIIIYKFEYVTDIITVFTTRPDTLFGATFMVLAPEHPLVKKITSSEKKKHVDEYIKQSQAKSDIERQETNREKTGVFTGAYAINPANKQQIPIWIADYVLYGYGTGAIMAVPAHDERDHEFAKRFDLPIVNVINPEHIREDAIGKSIDVNKDKIVAVVENSEGQLLSINWGSQYGGRLFIGGTVEGKENGADTAKREITEETGYTDLELISFGQEVYHYIYYAFSKGETHETNVSFYYFRLKSDSQKKQNLDESEKNKFKVEWVPRELADKEIVEPLHRYAYDKFILGKCHSGEGSLVNSGKYNGLSTSEMREKIVDDLHKHGVAKEVVNYKIRDWLISRQRYWGAPIPIIHCDKCGVVAVPKEQLPVELPKVENYHPTAEGKSVLASVESWVNTECPKCGGSAKRETDTMDGFACSSWYFLRFADPHNSKEPFAKDKARFWLPVDDYIGGAEHAVMHLLYARMWTKVMYDAGMIEFDEPFKALRNQGMILAPDGRKMSKSWGNVIAPDELIEQGYGADAIRVMELFIGPWNQEANWSVEGMGGCYRFLNRAWNITQEYLESKGKEQQISKEDAKLLQVTNKAIKKVTVDLHEMGFNTAIAALMQLVNELYKIKDEQGFANQKNWQFACESLAQLIAPFAPHIAEELWQELGQEGSVHTASWPEYDEGYLVEHVMKIAIQVNGKLRGEIEVEQGSAQDVIEAEAKKHENVAQYIKNDPKKVIYVPNKLINFVV